MSLKVKQEALERLLPIQEFSRTTNWTGRGSSRGLKGKLGEAINDCLKEDPEPKMGIISFVKLEDGGYEIRAYYHRK